MIIVFLIRIEQWLDILQITIFLVHFCMHFAAAMCCSSLQNKDLTNKLGNSRQESGSAQAWPSLLRPLLWQRIQKRIQARISLQSLLTFHKDVHKYLYTVLNDSKEDMYNPKNPFLKKNISQKKKILTNQRPLHLPLTNQRQDVFLCADWHNTR